MTLQPYVRKPPAAGSLRHVASRRSKQVELQRQRLKEGRDRLSAQVHRLRVVLSDSSRNSGSRELFRSLADAMPGVICAEWAP